MTTKIGGNVEVTGDTSLAGNLSVAGNIQVDGTVTFPALTPAGGTKVVSAGGVLGLEVSSIRYKVDVEDLWPASYNKVLELRPVWYRSHPRTTLDRTDWSWYGLIAEEVAEIEPRLVNWELSTGNAIPESVNYDRVSVMLLGVVKDQQKSINKLEEEIQALKAALKIT